MKVGIATTMMAAGVTAALVFACDGGTGPEPTRNEVPLAFSVNLAGTLVDEVVVEVTASDIDPALVFNFERLDDQASGTITVPAGSDRTITARAFDVSGIETHRGSTTIDVVEGSNPTVTLVMNPLTGEQPIEAVVGTIIVTIDPAADTLVVGDTVRFTATVTDGAGDTLQDKRVQWATLDQAVATIDTTGLATGVAPGNAEIVAVHATVGASAQLHVRGEVALWGVYEVEFAGPAGLANPFTDASGTVTFNGPSSQQYTVDMFYDGDGDGGQTGTVWKARFMPDEVGTWTWSSSSATQELDNWSGSLAATDSGLAGPFHVDPNYPYYFRRKTGEHELLLADWLFFKSSNPRHGSLNHNAAEVDDAERQGYIDFHADRNLTMYAVYLQNNGDLEGTVDPFYSGDMDRYDLTRWHAWEDRFVTLAGTYGFTLEFWLSSDEPFGFTDDQFTAFVTYAVARLGARRALWVLGLEVGEYWSSSQIDAFGAHLEDKLVQGQPITVHHNVGNNPDRGDAWVDYVAIQYGFDDAPSAINSESEAARDVVKPLYAAEFTNYQDSDDEARTRMWTAFVSGAASIGNGPGDLFGTTNIDMKYLADYANGTAAPGGASPDWWKMSPADSLVLSGECYLLRETGVRYLGYLPFGDSVEIDLAETSGTFTYDWFNPRDGTITLGGTVEAGAARTFAAPDTSDWLLDLRK